MKKMAVIDGNAIAHIVKHATKNLSFNGSNTGVLYGLIRKLFHIQEKIFADRYVFAWDSPEELIRHKVYPVYKENRKPQKEAETKLNSIAIPQFNIARLFMFPIMGFNNHIMLNGYEADDIIAKICEQFQEEYEIIIITRDGDLYQLLRDNKISMYDPVKFGYTTQRTFEAKYNIKVNQWAEVKAIAGCSGDNVIGVNGVGETTAIKFLNNELKPTSKKFKDIVAEQEKIISNLQLVMLPWEPTPDVGLVEDSLSQQGFIDACTQYGFQSYLREGLALKFEQLFISG